jgi:tRNA (cytidine/uridine-2'-O-)-methyltransferase
MDLRDVAKPEFIASSPHSRPCRFRHLPPMRLALYEPDIPQNTGTLLRLGACLGVAVDIIEPCGFVLSDRRLRRAGLDYLASAELTRHASWAAFLAAKEPEERLVLLTTQGTIPYHRFSFARSDILLLGRESAGVPPEVHATCAARLRIPMQPARRSLNVALAAAMVLGEAMRQTGLFSGEP